MFTFTEFFGSNYEKLCLFNFLNQYSLNLQDVYNEGPTAISSFKQFNLLMCFPISDGFLYILKTVVKFKLLLFKAVNHLVMAGSLNNNIS